MFVQLLISDSLWPQDCLWIDFLHVLMIFNPTTTLRYFTFLAVLLCSIVWPVTLCDLYNNFNKTANECVVTTKQNTDYLQLSLNDPTNINNNAVVSATRCDACECIYPASTIARAAFCASLHLLITASSVRGFSFWETISNVTLLWSWPCFLCRYVAMNNG